MIIFSTGILCFSKRCLFPFRYRANAWKQIQHWPLPSGLRTKCTFWPSATLLPTLPSKLLLSPARQKLQRRAFNWMPAIIRFVLEGKNYNWGQSVSDDGRMIAWIQLPSPHPIPRGGKLRIFIFTTETRKLKKSVCWLFE